MSGYLSKGMGPVQTIKRVKKNHDFFLENGYDINIFTLDCLPIPTYTKIKKKKSLIVDWLHKVAREMALMSKTYSKFRINLMFKECHRILDYYNSLDRHPNIIVFHSLFDMYEYLKYFKIEGVKYALFTHSDGNPLKMLFMSFPKLKSSKFEKEIYAREDYVISHVDIKPCIAKIEERTYLKKYPALGGKTILVENGIDDLSDAELKELSDIKSLPQKFKYRLVTTGSINGRKGQAEVIEALTKIPQEMLKDIHVDFVGEGPEKLELEQRIIKYGLSDNVSFLGYKPNGEVFKYLAQNNIYVLISKLEGLPLSILEALRAGISIISTNVSGIPEIVDSSNGVLIEPNVEELVEVFRNLDKYDWRVMGEASRKKFVDYYTFERMKNDYLKMLKKMS